MQQHERQHSEREAPEQKEALPERVFEAPRLERHEELEEMTRGDFDYGTTGTS